MMKETDATVPAVWVLIFDRYPMADESREAAETQSIDELPLAVGSDNAGTFDRLDLQSTCFEQFLLQNIRSESQSFDVFGGESALVQLATVMEKNHQTASLIRLTRSHTDLNEDAEFEALQTSLRRCQMPLTCEVKLDCGRLFEIEADKVNQAYSASLVWMEARAASSAESAVEYDQILGFVFEQLQHGTNAGKKCPVLIVTFRSGNEHRVLPPLSCGIEENRIHVPLWIRPVDGHTCRVQALAGSFDLLPTIATFLESPGASDKEVAQIQTSSQEAGAVTPPARPCSLAFLCGAPQVCPNRLLVLCGDGWKAARTEEFLLVLSDSHPSHSLQTESDGDGSAEPSRRLYVKPEDLFNINDVSGTYATTAESLARMLES